MHTKSLERLKKQIVHLVSGTEFYSLIEVIHQGTTISKGLWKQ